MTYVVQFGDPEATDAQRSGGKGSNLGKLTRAGFPVPPGFIVSTAAYRDFVRDSGHEDAVVGILSRIDYANAEDVEAKAHSIRALLSVAAIPAPVRIAVQAAYRQVADGQHVAVRSSGTAEDLAEASFAGQHDTYLDIRGEDSLFDALRRCWASMWSARAIAYRQQRGIAQTSIGIAVVIQKMVSSEVSGVMFTANPVTGAVNEIVVNSSWGLGEGVVSGILTPDQFVLDQNTLSIKSVTIGSKAIKVVRNPETGVGTVEQSVAAAQLMQPTLSKGELHRLATLGRGIQAYYEGYPQDIEWALADGEFHILQARDVTGVEFSWDEDLDRYEACPPEVPDTVWTRMWSDMVWPGAVTPLFYSMRAEMLQRMHTSALRMWGFNDVARLRMVKYDKGRVYYNSAVDYGNQSKFIPPVLRKMGLLAHMPDAWHEQIKTEPWSWTAPIIVLLRVCLLDPAHRPLKVYDHLYEVMRTRVGEAEGPGTEQLRAMPDAELQPCLLSRIMLQKEFVEDQWTLFILYFPVALTLFKLMIQRWYDETDQWIINDLFVGIPEPTATLKENLELWNLAEKIRRSEVLSSLFAQHQGRAFFERAASVPEGKAFCESYSRFVEEFGHRGHSDRDIYGDRRRENPGIDYANFRVLLTGESHDPKATLQALIARREAATKTVITSIRRKRPFAGLKVLAFNRLHRWLLKFWEMRDNERQYVDRITLSKKRVVCEVGRRLNERGILSDDDFYFLSKEELFGVLRSGRCDRLTKEKIVARRRNFQRVAGGAKGPKYIQNRRYVDLDGEVTSTNATDTAFRGIGTSRGTVTGIARVVSSQKEIGRVRKGDILITSATDPGWTPVFLVISGLVLETGGTLSHGACISREYGIPAVQFPDAMSVIKEGSLISLDGEAGEVRILAPPPSEETMALAGV